jgi:hypothetical protein
MSVSGTLTSSNLLVDYETMLMIRPRTPLQSSYSNSAAKNQRIQGHEHDEATVMKLA